MKIMLSAALTSLLLTGPAAMAQQPTEQADPRRADDRMLEEDPRIGALVQTPAGERVGRVSRLEFQTDVRAVVTGYLVDVTDLTGREPFQLYVSDENAVWTDLSGTSVLQVNMTIDELEQVAAFADTRPAAFEFDDRWTGDTGVEAADLLENPDAARPVGDPAPLMGEDELSARIEWDAGFDTGSLTVADWSTMTAYTPDDDPFGVVSEVQTEEGEPARIVVQTLPEYYDLGVSLVFDIADIEAVSETRSEFKIDPSEGSQP